MRGNDFRALSLLLLLLSPAAFCAPTVDFAAEPVVSAAAPPRSVALPPALATVGAEALSFGDPVQIDREVRAGTAKAAVAEAAKLTTLTEHMTYAQSSGARVVLVPFDGGRYPGMSPDSLAQAETEDRMIFMNWSLAGADRYGFERAGLSAEEAQRTTALALAPVLGHELKHLKLRADAGRDFPALREEEILTHLDQAAAFDEILRREPGLRALGPLLARNFLFPHNEALLKRWREGFGAVAGYVNHKYDNVPSLSEPEKNLAVARVLRERWARGDAQDIPERWRERIARAVAFWGDPAAVKSVTEFLQARILEAFAAYRRTLH